MLSEKKVNQIKTELGLSETENLFLSAYETHRNINGYLDEPNVRRKTYFRKLALENAREMVAIVEGWRYGNIPLTRKFFGDKIDLLKDNLRRLVLSNVAKGNEEVLKKNSEILIEFCKHLRSPSIETLDELNAMIKEDLPYKEYKVLTKKAKMGEYFHSRPRAFRLLFALVISVIIAVVLFCLRQNIGLIVAVCVTCFWGAFAGFDKLFRLEKK